MTLVIGALCSDGLFFCSDTEEGTALGGKRAVRKMVDVGGTEWHMIVGAAGFGPLCDIAMKRIAESALASADLLRDHTKIIEDIVGEIYKKYIPHTLPDRKQLERQICLIVGLVDLQSGNTFLYKTHEEIAQPISQPFACAGVGEEVAYYFLDRVFQDFRPPAYTGAVPATNEAEPLLRFVMKEGKVSVGGVGGDTETILVNHKGHVSHGTFGAGWEGKQPELRDVISYFWLGEKLTRSKPRKSKGQP